jgi:hypothetical protein
MDGIMTGSAPIWAMQLQLQFGVDFINIGLPFLIIFVMADVGYL